jgi:hypothetical protein
MQPPTIHYTQNTLRYTCEEGSIHEIRPLATDDTSKFQAWIDSYRKVINTVNLAITNNKGEKNGL